MPCNPKQFIDEVPDYDCRDGRIYVTMGSYCLAMPVHIFLQGTELGKRAIVAWQKSERAKHARVIPIKKLRPSH